MIPVVAGDEEGWEAALARLRRLRGEPAARLAARERYDRRATRVAALLVASAVVLAVAVLVVDPPPDAGGDPPAWRVVVGFSIGGAGLLLALLAPLARPFGSRPGLGLPLRELDRRQRRELLDQVRGRAGVEPARLALARLSAEVLLEQQRGLLTSTGMVVSFLGLWIVDRSTVRAVPTWLGVAVLAVAAVRAVRDGRLARRFLAEHPAPEERPGGAPRGGGATGP